MLLITCKWMLTLFGKHSLTTDNRAISYLEDGFLILAKNQSVIKRISFCGGLTTTY